MTEQTRPTGYSTGASCERTWESRRVRDTGAMQPAPAPVRALVVDDEPVLAGTVATYLDRAGFQTCVVADGREAVEVARGWVPEVVVLDLGLPGLDGVEVCRQIRTFSDCYILVVTARKDEIDTLIGLSVGADDYITKPFSPRELVARVRAMLRRPRVLQSATATAEREVAPPRRFGALSWGFGWAVLGRRRCPRALRGCG